MGWCRNLRQMRELELYLVANHDEAVCYSREHRAGQRVTTAPIESTINHLINHRLNKRSADELVAGRRALPAAGSMCVAQRPVGQHPGALVRWVRCTGCGCGSRLTLRL